MDFAQLRDTNPNTLKAVATAWRAAAKELESAGNECDKVQESVTGPGWKGRTADAAAEYARQREGALGGGHIQAATLAKIIEAAIPRIVEVKRKLDEVVQKVHDDEGLVISETGQVKAVSPNDLLPLVMPGLLEKYTQDASKRAAALETQINGVLAEAERIDAAIVAEINQAAQPKWKDAGFMLLSTYIFQEIETNRNDPTTLAMRLLTKDWQVRLAQELSKTIWFGMKVWPESHLTDHPGVQQMLKELGIAEWDHKPPIKEALGMGDKISETYVEVPGTGYRIRGDVWSNIHFGYIGRSIGLAPWVLHAGANGADGITNGAPEPADQKAVQMGIDLHTKFPDGKLTQDQLMAEIKDKLDDIHRSEKHGPNSEGTTMVEKIPDAN